MCRFNCNYCNYTTLRLNDYTKHLKTNKHLNNVNIHNKDNKYKNKINDLVFKKEKKLIINLINKSEINKNILLSNTISRVCGHIYLLYYNNKKYNNVFILKLENQQI